MKRNLLINNVYLPDGILNGSFIAAQNNLRLRIEVGWLSMNRIFVHSGNTTVVRNKL